VIVGGLEDAMVYDAVTGNAVCRLRYGSQIRRIRFSPDGTRVAIAGVHYVPGYGLLTLRCPPV